MCILYGFSITIIRDSPFSFSLFTTMNEAIVLSNSSSQYVPYCFDLQFMPSNKEILINMKDENEKLSS